MCIRDRDLLHKLEIENLTRDERAKLATELRDCRRLRRKYKDVVEELEPIAGYLSLIHIYDGRPNKKARTRRAERRDDEP